MRKTVEVACKRERAWLAVLAAAFALAGCVELLLKEREQVASPWHDFGEAKAAIEKIVPYETTQSQLKEGGIDPYASPNITLLTYSDVILRFPLGGAVPQEKLDRGLRECLNAGKACYGYAIAARDTRRERTANFWLDSLRFYRQVDVSGWSFNATILLIDDLVVYTLYGGQPLVREQDASTQPLGPLQGWGDTLPALVH
jgi:hypothetical protein